MALDICIYYEGRCSLIDTKALRHENQEQWLPIAFREAISLLKECDDELENVHNENKSLLTEVAALRAQASELEDGASTTGVSSNAAISTKLSAIRYIP